MADPQDITAGNNDSSPADKKNERNNQKDLMALQNAQAGGSGKGPTGGAMGQGGVSKGKMISSVAKMLPGGDYALDIAVVLAGASIYFFPWAFDIMKDDGLCKRNIYRLLAMVLIWMAIIIMVLYLIAYIVSCLRHPFECGWGAIQGLIWD